MISEGATFVTWCSICSAEPAVSSIEVEIDGRWYPLDVGEDCLTRAETDGKLDL